jgi:hypothetical protein
MTPRKPTHARALGRLVAATALAAVPWLAHAQATMFDGMLQQQIQLMNQNIARGQQMVNQTVAQRMQDPAVRQAYGQYLQQMHSRGQAPMAYQQFAYYHVYTNAFTPQGMAHMRNNEANLQNQERQRWIALQQAQQMRRDAQQVNRDVYFRNQQEAGRGLRGESTYHGNGGSRVLPHTWQPNTVHDHQGRRYWVDHAGQYHVITQNGWAVPISR